MSPGCPLGFQGATVRNRCIPNEGSSFFLSFFSFFFFLRFYLFIFREGEGREEERERNMDV